MKTQQIKAAEPMHDRDRRTEARATSAAAWPSGVSLLAQMIDAGRRRDAQSSRSYTAIECRVLPAAR